MLCNIRDLNSESDNLFCVSFRTSKRRTGVRSPSTSFKVIFSNQSGLRFDFNFIFLGILTGECVYFHRKLFEERLQIWFEGDRASVNSSGGGAPLQHQPASFRCKCFNSLHGISVWDSMHFCIWLVAVRIELYLKWTIFYSDCLLKICSNLGVQILLSGGGGGGGDCINNDAVWCSKSQEIPGSSCWSPPCNVCKKLHFF